jgi:hypothetical protein
MLEKLEGLPGNVMGVKASGVVTKQDYLTVLDPMIEQARRTGRGIRLLYQFGPAFERFSSGGAWEDARIGLTDMRLFEGVAIVTDVAWLRESVGMARLLMACPVRVYANDELHEAANWLESLPPGDVVAHLLDEQRGVLVVEPKDPLRVRDFDALERTIEPWIAEHGQLDGVVVHTITFPGWASFAAFVRHMRFMREYRRKARRLAIVSDSKLADVIPSVAANFVAPQIRQFDYDQIDDALDWAGREQTGGYQATAAAR